MRFILMLNNFAC